MTAAQQEAFVSTGLILQAASGVQTEIYYGYDDPSTSLYNPATGQLTAAGVAYQETEQWLTGATLPSGYQLNGSVYTVQLVKNGQSELIVWNSAGQSSFSAGSFTEYVNAQGQVEPIVNGEVTIGTVPILLEGYRDLNAGQIGALYEAVLQRAPTATEVTASLALDAMTFDVGVIVSLVSSAEAISNVYPILQMFELAFGYFPSAATLASMVDTGLTVPQLAAAIVASQAFANTYNGGALIDPNAPVTAAIVEALYSEALGHAPTTATLEGWLTSGLTIAQAFEEMVTSQSYFETTQSSIEQYLTAAAINQAGLTTINGSQATGAHRLDRHDAADAGRPDGRWRLRSVDGGGQWSGRYHHRAHYQHGWRHHHSQWRCRHDQFRQQHRQRVGDRGRHRRSDRSDDFGRDVNLRHRHDNLGQRGRWSRRSSRIWQREY